MRFYLRWLIHYNHYCQHGQHPKFYLRPLALLFSLLTNHAFSPSMAQPLQPLLPNMTNIQNFTFAHLIMFFTFAGSTTTASVANI
jgi:hypothetical protein